MRPVDTEAEQEVLERLIERSKPPVTEEARHLDYLLNTPFRYVSPHPSRFRPEGQPGVWYGAERIETACAEVGYWRWRFLMESDGLRDQRVVVEFTLFEARVEGRALDLTMKPWAGAATLWANPQDYSACHELAHDARVRSIQWIRYLSVRDPAHAPCGAVFDALALSLPRPTSRQTWAARVQHDRVVFSHEGATLEFATTQWS
jgi:hypothetical protein